MTILVCGEALYDFFQIAEPEPGALSFDARVGGSPFNVAVGIARLGGEVALLTGISSDLLGERLHARLREEDVDTRYIVRSGRRTTLSLVGLDAQGHPDYAFYGVGSADCALSAADMPDLPPEIRALHFGSYSLAVPPVADALSGLARRHADRFISLDPNVRPTIEPDMAVWRARLDAMRRHADLIKVSAEDLGMLYPGQDPADIARTWIADGCGLVVVTAGGDTVTAFRGTRQIGLAPRPVAVVDTVGAGDSFQAALLGYLQTQGTFSVSEGDLPDQAVRQMLERASQAASITCTRRGADLPRSADLPQF